MRKRITHADVDFLRTCGIAGEVEVITDLEEDAEEISELTRVIVFEDEDRA